MSRRDDLLKLLIVVLFAGFITYSPAGGPTAGKPTAAPLVSAPADDAPASPTSTLADTLICDYLEGSVAASTAKATVTGVTGCSSSPRLYRPPEFPATRVRFLTAALPDAIDSESGWLFDSMMDAINSAVAVDGYALFRASFPDRGVPRRPGAEPPTRHEREPAVIVYHRAAPGASARAEDPDLLVVLIAYESATTGVHRAALRAALAYVVAHQPAVEQLRLLGPAFSGSAPSIDATLREMTTVNDRMCVVTGSATAATVRKTLSAWHFRSTVLDDNVVVPQLRSFVRDRLLVSRPVLAELVESTPYGDEIGFDSNVRRYRFPLHVARLRGRDATPEEPGNPRVPVALADGVEPTDRLPVMTPNTTEPAVDLMLSSIFAQMRRDRVDAVGLFATDTRDKLFLAQALAREFPGLLLYTTEADVLYTHPQYRRAVRGMIVASTYPAVSADTVGKAHYLFPNSSAIGTFNAVRTLLGKTDLLDFNEGAGSPPVWVSVVSRTGLLPVTRESKRTLPNVTDTTAPEAPSAGASGWLWLLSGFLAFLSTLHIVAEWQVFRRPPEEARRSPVGRFIRWSETSGVRYRLYLVVSLLALVILNSLVLLAWLSGVSSGPDGAVLPMIGGGLMALTVCAAIVALIGAFAGLSSTPAEVGEPAPADDDVKAWREQLLWTMGLMLALMAVVTLSLAVRTMWGDVDDRPLLFERIAQPVAGTSALFALGLILAPVYAWGVMHTLALGRPPMEQLTRCIGMLGAGMDATWTPRFLNTLRRPVAAGMSHYAVLAGLSLVVTGTSFWLAHVASIEVSTVTLALLCIWLVVQLLLAASLIEAWSMWRHFREGLRRLGAHPLSEGYRALSTELIGDRLTPKRPDVLALAQIARELSGLETVPDSFPHQLRTLVDGQLPEKVGEQWTRDVRGRVWSWTRSETFQASCAAAPAFIHVLEASLWKVSCPFHDPASLEWLQRANRVLGMLVALFVRETLSRLASRLYFMMFTTLCLVATQSVFTLHPRQVPLALTWIYGVLSVGASVSIFVALERDPVMSALSNTSNGRVDWDRAFVGKLLLYGAVPLLTLFAVQFPQMSEMVGRWLGPVQQGLP